MVQNFFFPLDSFCARDLLIEECTRCASYDYNDYNENYKWHSKCLDNATSPWLSSSMKHFSGSRRNRHLYVRTQLVLEFANNVQWFDSCSHAKHQLERLGDTWATSSILGAFHCTSGTQFENHLLSLVLEGTCAGE